MPVLTQRCRKADGQRHVAQPSALRGRDVALPVGTLHAQLPLAEINVTPFEGHDLPAPQSRTSSSPSRTAADAGPHPSSASRPPDPECRRLARANQDRADRSRQTRLPRSLSLLIAPDATASNRLCEAEGGAAICDRMAIGASPMSVNSAEQFSKEETRSGTQRHETIADIRR